MKKFIWPVFGFVVLSSLATLVAHADSACDTLPVPVCGTLQDCLAIQTRLAARIQILSPAPISLTSFNGHKFTQVTNQPSLGNAWRDESGPIWGDMVLDYVNGGGDLGGKWMTHPAAIAYCGSIGARLPTRKQFEQLAKYLGYGSKSGYSAEILPKLSGNSF